MDAFKAALEGLTALDGYLTAKGKHDVLFTDFSSPVSFKPAKEGLPVPAADLEESLKKLAP
jgi:hypothetical protein